MSFKPIETQEELDAVIKDRIERAKKGVYEQFSDHDELKAKVTSYEAEIAKLSEQLKTQADQMSQSTATVDELTAKIKNYETASVKTRIAHEVGIPFELASKLSGEDEESIREDANRIAKYIVKPAAPIGEPEATYDNTDPVSADLAALASQLKEDF